MDSLPLLSVTVGNPFPAERDSLLYSDTEDEFCERDSLVCSDTR